MTDRQRHFETVITIDVSIHKTNGNEATITRHETQLNLTSETRLNAIAQFEKEASALIKKARKASTQGHYVFVDVARATYSHIEIDGCYDFNTHKTERFEMWSGRGDNINEEGVYLSPCEQYNEDLYHDLYLTGKDILKELTI